MMRTLAWISIFLLNGLSVSSAQTTGLAGTNDLTWTAANACVLPPQGSGGESCAPSTICCGLFGGGLLEFTTNAPFSPVFLLLSANCVPNSPCLPIAFAYPGIPPTACSGGGNQSLDLVGVTILAAGITDGFGNLTIPVPAGLTPPWIDIQAAVVDLGAGSAINIVVSQALHIES